ncbi:uncharacterized protein LOC126703659 isoform X3 [Quercus robur]|uniref:uncharacterized protein LOC126703659 isoform X3 n=1 Tax=Quercus robur TaxID=38942 RepID=UPI002163A219|nr:uncharacterized protein LOC126703659 isoform X3 [Quercus robur]
MAGRLTELELERDNSFSFKAAAKKAVELISKALAYILSFKAAATKVVELISKALAYILSDDAEALGFYEAFHTVLAFLVMLLVALIGLHLQPLSISPLEKHFAIILTFIAAIIVYGIAYVLTKLKPQDAKYLSKFRFIRLVFGIIAIELLASIIISPFWLSMVILCSILIVGVLCLYEQIYQLVHPI